MGLLARVGAWLRSVPAFQFSAYGSQYFGPGIGSQPSAETLLRESTGPFDAGTRAIASRVAELELIVKVRRPSGKSGTVVEEELDDHPVKLLLDNPHPNLDTATLLYNAAGHAVRTGECLWQKVYNGFGRPVQLHPMPPGRVVPLPDRGILTGYLVTDARGVQTRIGPDEVVRAWWPDPENLWGAEGYLSPTGLAHDAHKFAMQHLRYRYQHDATPKGVLEAGPDATPFLGEEKRRYQHEWDQAYNSRDGRIIAPAILPTGYIYKQVAMDTREGVAVLTEQWRDDLLMALKVPRAVLGQVVSGDRSSAEVMQWTFDRYAVTPVTNLIARALTSQLAREFDPRLIVAFRRFVAEDKDFELRREAQDIQHGVRTINKVLEDRDDDPVAWGNEPLVANTLGLYDPALQRKKQVQAAQPKPSPAPAGASATNGGGGGDMGGDMGNQADMADMAKSARAERAEHIAIRRKYAAERKAAREGARA